jgi:hypothetical protein
MVSFMFGRVIHHSGGGACTSTIVLTTVYREIFTALKVGEFAFFQLAVYKILHLLQKFNG